MKQHPQTHEQFLATIDQDRFPEAICTIWGELDYILRWTVVTETHSAVTEELPRSYRTVTETRLAVTERHPEGITSSQIWFVVQ